VDRGIQAFKVKPGKKKVINFMYFFPCIVDIQSRALSQQNAQCSSLDIYITLAH